MRVFVTGATGFIGTAVVPELLAAGHQVLGLTRSDKGAETLKSLGVEAHRGSLEDLESLKKGASSADATIHLAFDHNFADFEGINKKDRVAIEAIGEALVGTNRPFIITSGTLLLPLEKLATEDDNGDYTIPTAVRGLAEQLTLSFVPKGVRAEVVRLPPTNYGEGDHGFIAMLIKTAREKGESAYIGDGSNRWPATHRLDTAKVFASALDRGTAGATYHAVANEGITAKEIAEAIGKELNVPVVSKSTEEAPAHFGFLALPFSRDNPTSSKKTREALGWEPAQPGLIADIKEGHYFKN
ncbi:putative epimerase/dehydratase [Mytilinidion resinicola]|uniref:Epimerase/dehydratase n=1 Tax=Mytilinidion resinicola TaxID=574789 RepID=A0A6A6Y172_9PEZI|nr:putative epimerase/dehydratase [Mytilinidion resinicola]KAF2802522.1 putative epimerase/dehydratase [Mytilinidion resinicola]